MNEESSTLSVFLVYKCRACGELHFLNSDYNLDDNMNLVCVFPKIVQKSTPVTQVHDCSHGHNKMAGISDFVGIKMERFNVK